MHVLSAYGKTFVTYSGFSLYLFSTMEYISDLAKVLNPPHPCQVLKLLFYILKHNVPLYLTLTFTTSILLMKTNNLRASLGGLV